MFLLLKLETTAEIPRVNNRWNNEQLLQQALQLILNGQVEYGYVNKAREIIKLKSTMIKSQGNLLKGIYNKTVEGQLISKLQDTKRTI